MKNMSLDNLTTLFIVFDCEERLMHQDHSLKDQNSNQIQIHSNSKKY